MYSTRSYVEPVDPSLVPYFISKVDIALYTQLAILSLLVYDTIITMDKEIKYFWNRYIGILGAVLAVVGQVSGWLEGLANILLMRVLALYRGDKRLAASLKILFAMDAAFTLGILIYSNIYEESTNFVVVGELAKGVTFCGEIRAPPKVWNALCWAMPMLYEIALMVLALYKAAEYERETAGFTNQSDRVIFSDVMEIISVELFVSEKFLSNLLNILGSPSFLCVLGSRMLVRLKEAGERVSNEGTSIRLTTMSDMDFS
ncbi:hypothetical protein DFH11DRAFT_1547921 [Phellopilus nigrolimitatus]|nr:hypothetical protein DFH11DRAFT_1547921 [Phellopilus nigrolimitatus]